MRAKGRDKCELIRPKCGCSVILVILQPTIAKLLPAYSSFEKPKSRVKPMWAFPIENNSALDVGSMAAGCTAWGAELPSSASGIHWAKPALQRNMQLGKGFSWRASKDGVFGSRLLDPLGNNYNAQE